MRQTEGEKETDRERAMTDRFISARVHCVQEKRNVCLAEGFLCV